MSLDPLDPNDAVSAPAAAEILTAKEVDKHERRMLAASVKNWETGMNLVWDWWTDGEKTVRDQTKVAGIISNLGAAWDTFTRSTLFSGAILQINPTLVANVLIRLKLWNESAVAIKAEGQAYTAAEVVTAQSIPVTKDDVAKTIVYNAAAELAVG